MEKTNTDYKTTNLKNSGYAFQDAQTVFNWKQTVMQAFCLFAIMSTHAW